VSTRFPPGTSGNASGISRSREQFNQLLADAMRDPQRLEKALKALDKAIEAGESWAALFYLSRVWPERKFISAAVEVSTDDDTFTEFFSRIARLAARSAAGRALADAQPRTTESSEVRVEVLGPAEPTGT
jgi:hypothetical protein